jgi:hypothetical protein
MICVFYLRSRCVCGVCRFILLAAAAAVLLIAHALTIININNN